LEDITKLYAGCLFISFTLFSAALFINKIMFFTECLDWINMGESLGLNLAVIGKYCRVSHWRRSWFGVRL